MTTRDQLIDLIHAHQRNHGIRDLRTHCRCGWVSDDYPNNGRRQHTGHVADAILSEVKL
jgi:hypothetical protein